MSAATAPEPQFVGGPLDGDPVDVTNPGDATATIHRPLIGKKDRANGTYLYAATPNGDWRFEGEE